MDNEEKMKEASLQMQNSLNKVAEMFKTEGFAKSMDTLAKTIDKSIEINELIDSSIKKFVNAPTQLNAINALNFYRLKDVNDILTAQPQIIKKNVHNSLAIAENRPIDKFIQIKIKPEDTIRFYKDMFEKVKGDLDASQLEDVVSYWLIGGEDDLTRILEKSRFSFSLDLPKMNVEIVTDIVDMIKRARRSYMMALYQGSVFYFGLILETIVKSKLKATRFKSLLQSKLRISTKKQLDDSTLGWLLSDDDINGKLFKNYNRSISQTVVAVRNLNTHNYNDNASPDVTASLKLIKKLIESIK